jgi:alginate O-acetyltransferase complex protein AlgI
VENFKHPYISQSITEFWRRWHISLSSWLRDYLYVPLGGNRHGKVKTYRNLLLTMILGGFWHGANWTFLIWGIWHGSLLAIEKAVGLNVSAESARDRFVITRWVLTLFLVMLGWVVFRAETITSAMTLYAAMFDFSSLYISEVYAATIRHSQLAILAAAWVLIVYRGFQQRAQELDKDFIVMPRVYAALLIPLFFIALLKLSAQSYSAFLYFQF